MNLKDLKQKSPTELLAQAEELGIEDASSMRKQDLMFGILKKTVGEDEAITGEGTIEVLQDGFGFLRSSESRLRLPPLQGLNLTPSNVIWQFLCHNSSELLKEQSSSYSLPFVFAGKCIGNSF